MPIGKAVLVGCGGIRMRRHDYGFKMSAYAGPTPATHSSMTEGMIRFCEGNNVTSENLQRAKVYLAEYEECYPIVSQYARLPVELEAAKQDGTVDEVARRFCAKADEIKSCGAKASYAMGLCAKLDEQKDIPYTINTSKRTIDYLCKEDDHKTILAKFVEEGAIQCFKDRAQGFQLCVGSLGVHPFKDIKNSNDNLSKCAVEQLKACSSILGARAQNMLDYIRDLYGD